MKTELKGNSLELRRAATVVGSDSPPSIIVRDGHHKGSLFTWLGDRWCVVDLENRELTGFYARVAVVTVFSSKLDCDAGDNGLNQVAIGFDMDVGEWVVSADDLEDLRETYGEDLEVIWEQE